MRYYICALLLALFALPTWAEDDNNPHDCGYLEEITFSNMYTRLVNRGPNMLAGYGTVTNNSSKSRTLVGVSTPNAKSSSFRTYRQVGGAGDITAQPVSQITIPNQGGSYTWVLGGQHIALEGFDKKATAKKLQFGTDFDPNQTVDITFKFIDGCKKTVKDVPIRDRMQ